MGGFAPQSFDFIRRFGCVRKRIHLSVFAWDLCGAAIHLRRMSCVYSFRFARELLLIDSVARSSDQSAEVLQLRSGDPARVVSQRRAELALATVLESGDGQPQCRRSIHVANAPHELTIRPCMKRCHLRIHEIVFVLAK